MFMYTSHYVYVHKSLCLRTQVIMFTYTSYYVYVHKSLCLRTKVIMFMYTSHYGYIPKSSDIMMIMFGFLDEASSKNIKD